jgi:hypothetical protein
MSREQDMFRVRDAYREIATETSPSNLDEEVLSMAERETRTRYGLARAWVRPVAWAATIALSFTFVLEMTYFSEDPTAIDAPKRERIESESVQDAVPAARDAPFKRTPAAVAPAPEMKTRKAPPPAGREERADEVAASLASSALMEASNRERQSEDRAPALDYCDAETRQNADTWYSCVLALRDQGLDDAARAELEGLLGAFPDFREPVPE